MTLKGPMQWHDRQVKSAHAQRLRAKQTVVRLCSDSWSLEYAAYSKQPLHDSKTASEVSRWKRSANRAEPTGTVKESTAMDRWPDESRSLRRRLDTKDDLCGRASGTSASRQAAAPYERWLFDITEVQICAARPICRQSSTASTGWW